MEPSPPPPPPPPLLTLDSLNHPILRRLLTRSCVLLIVGGFLIEIDDDDAEEEDMFMVDILSHRPSSTMDPHESASHWEEESEAMDTCVPNNLCIDSSVHTCSDCSATDSVNVCPNHFLMDSASPQVHPVNNSMHSASEIYSINSIDCSISPVPCPNLMDSTSLATCPVINTTAPISRTTRPNSLDSSLNHVHPQNSNDTSSIGILPNHLTNSSSSLLDDVSANRNQIDSTLSASSTLRPNWMHSSSLSVVHPNHHYSIDPSSTWTIPCTDSIADVSIPHAPNGKPASSDDLIIGHGHMNQRAGSNMSSFAMPTDCSHEDLIIGQISISEYKEMISHGRKARSKRKRKGGKRRRRRRRRRRNNKKKEEEEEEEDEDEDMDEVNHVGFVVKCNNVNKSGHSVVLGEFSGKDTLTRTLMCPGPDLDMLSVESPRPTMRKHVPNLHQSEVPIDASIVDTINIVNVDENAIGSVGEKIIGQSSVTPVPRPMLLMLNKDFIVTSPLKENLMLTLALTGRKRIVGDNVEPSDQTPFRQDDMKRHILVGQFRAFSSFLHFRLGHDAMRVRTESNAGGTSTISESLSVEYFVRRFGAKDIVTEMEVEYCTFNWKKVDYICSLYGQRVGVSVTRAMSFPDPKEFSAQMAYRLLYKKLFGLVVARHGVSKQHCFSQCILHVWCETQHTAHIMQREYDGVSRELDIADDVIMVLTIAEGWHARPIFYESLLTNASMQVR